MQYFTYGKMAPSPLGPPQRGILENQLPLMAAIVPQQFSQDFQLHLSPFPLRLRVRLSLQTNAVKSPRAFLLLPGPVHHSHNA